MKKRHRRRRLLIGYNRHLELVRASLNPAEIAWVDYVLYRKPNNPYLIGTLQFDLYRDAFYRARIALPDLHPPKMPKPKRNR